MSAKLDKIEAILVWYHKECDSCELAILMHKSDQLANLAYGLAKELGSVHGAYNHAYFIRRINVSKTVNKLVQKGLAMNKSDHEALEENEAFFSEEKEKESESFSLNLLLKQVNKILERMNQRISYLKIELNGN